MSVRWPCYYFLFFNILSLNLNLKQILKKIKTFRDKEIGEYYEKHIMNLNSDEVDKTFVDVKPISNFLELKNQMGLSK